MFTNNGAALVNQLVEAQREQTLSGVLARWSRVELIVIDELGYVPLAEVAAELLFQVVAERATGEAVTLFLAGYFGTNKRSPKTKHAYTIDFKQFRDFVGADFLLESVAPQNLEAWAAHLQAKPYEVASIRRKIASARVFFSDWVRRGTLTISPLWKLRFTLGRTRVLPRSLSAADIELLIRESWRRYKLTCRPGAKVATAHVLAARDLAMVESLFATGMRVTSESSRSWISRTGLQPTHPL